MNPGVFREYDIRGVADRDFPDEFVADLARAIVSFLRQGGARRITLGRDCRVSSPRIHAAMLGELLASGMDVQDIGIVHSPGLYFSVFHLDSDGGVMITASHNPADDNGFKVMRGRSTIYGDDIQELRRRIEQRSFVTVMKRGTCTDVDILTPYVKHLVSNIKLGSRPVRVVVDGGNGTGGPAIIPALQQLGVDVTSLYCEPDGRFPNHHPDPTVPANLVGLINKVRETGAEIGIALDGDADRIGVVDPRGRIVWGDQLMILFARDILKERPGATFVSEVKCSQALYDDIAANGGRAIMWKVGHSLIKAKMKEEGAALAGEMSGHMFFADRYFGFDDAVYAGLRMVELLSRSKLTLAQLVDTLPVLHNTPEIRMHCPDEIKFEVVARAVAALRSRYSDVVDVDGARVRVPGGWGLVRASNTGPVLVLRFEAESPQRVAEIQGEFNELLDGIIKKVAAEKGVTLTPGKAAH